MNTENRHISAKPESPHNSNLPHRKNIRLTHYDYSSPGMYFVTICTHNRRLLFGEIVNGNMSLSEIGRCVQDELINIPGHYTHVSLDTYVVMPNHIHMILWIHAGEDSNQDTPPVLGTIIGGFKSGVSRKCGTAVWQRGYYEHIIRNEKDLLEIQTYISNNPIKWELDRHNPAHPRYAQWHETQG